MTTSLLIETFEDRIRLALQQNDEAMLRTLLSSRHPADIADVLDRLDRDDRLRLFQLIEPEQAADVLSETSIDATRAIIAGLKPADIRELFHLMDVDDVVEILGEDLPEQQQALLEYMEPEEASGVRQLLAYPRRSAGRLLNENFPRAYSDMTVGQAMDILQAFAADFETPGVVYVTDADERFQGIVRLRGLLRNPPARLLAEILDRDIATVEPQTDQEDVARIVSQYDLLAVPVVNQRRQVLGIVTVDDVIDVLVQEGTEDVLRFGAVQEGATDEVYFDVPIRRALQRRIGWLLLLFVTGLLTVNVLNFFEATLAQVVSLSFFIPLLIGTGGNTGAQTVSTIVRSLATGEVQLRDLRRVIGRELFGGLLLGLLLGVAAFGVALLLGNGFDLALVVAISIVAICAWANTIGAVVPMLAQRFKLDPALVSAPLITTLVDATGLAIYLSVARLILGI
jgi:magnesium transporter